MNAVYVRAGSYDTAQMIFVHSLQVVLPRRTDKTPEQLQPVITVLAELAGICVTCDVNRYGHVHVLLANKHMIAVVADCDEDEAILAALNSRKA